MLEIESIGFPPLDCSSVFTLDASHVSVPSGFGLSICDKWDCVDESFFANMSTFTISAISVDLSHADFPYSDLHPCAAYIQGESLSYALLNKSPHPPTSPLVSRTLLVQDLVDPPQISLFVKVYPPAVDAYQAVMTWPLAIITFPLVLIAALSHSPPFGSVLNTWQC